LSRRLSRWLATALTTLAGLYRLPSWLSGVRRLSTLRRSLVRRVVTLRRRRIMLWRRSVLRRCLFGRRRLGFLGWGRRRILFLVFVVLLLRKHKRRHGQKQKQQWPLRNRLLDRAVQVHRGLLNFLPVTQDEHCIERRTSIDTRNENCREMNISARPSVAPMLLNGVCH